MPLTYEPIRLIWVADLVSLVEAWLDRIDWDRVRRQYPAAYAMLPLLHALTPWGDAARAHLRAEDPAPSLLPPRVELRQRTALLEETLGYAADLQAQVTRLHTMLDAGARYIAHLEGAVEVKNAHIHDLETRLRQREAELVAARTPRWPWKRHKQDR